jgi:hypothetical protein
MRPRQIRRKSPGPAGCANGSRGRVRERQEQERKRWKERRSTELIQKQEAGDEDTQGNPEMDIGGNDPKQLARLVARHCHLEVNPRESGETS